MSYGVQRTGFVRKNLATILDEREQAMVEAFGPGVIQTAQSPLGQINGLLSELEAILWETAEDTYQSYDPDQAEGVALERLARLRLISRGVGETDATLARAITNAGRANVRDADFYRAVLNADGVTWARIYANDTNAVDDNGMDPHSVSVVALGGDDEEIAAIARRYIVPGITSFGNTRVDTTIDGFCRSIWIMRPVPVRVRLQISVRRWQDASGCPPPALAVIAEVVAAAMTGEGRPANGQDITDHLIRTAVSCAFPNVEVVAAQAARGENSFVALPLILQFDEIASVALADVAVTAV